MSETTAAVGLTKVPATGARKWLAFGTGVAVEIVGESLVAVAVKLRPRGVEVLAARVWEDFASRRASEWGTEFADWARRAGARKAPVNVVLPRRDVVVRALSFPGVAEADLEGAVGFQIDGLHPWADDGVVHGWSRLEGSSTVLVGIAERATVDHYANVFSEAGVACGGFTFPAAALFGAARVVTRPAGGFLAWRERGGEVEAYGESASRPVFSAVFDAPPERVERMALGELRLGEDTAVVPVEALLPPLVKTPAEFDASLYAVAVAAAVGAAAPRLSVDANLLDPARRVRRSALRYVPTALLLAAVAVVAVVLWLQHGWEEKRLLEKLNAEAMQLELAGAKVVETDKTAAVLRERIDLLDRYRLRAKGDAEALRELTNLIAPPAWINGLEMLRQTVNFTGEGAQSAALLKLIDESKLFRDSNFGPAIGRAPGGAELFSIRTVREGPGTGLEAGEIR